MYRQIWMFPRNKRRILPLETALFLKAMVVASELGSNWTGDQKQQNHFAKLLEDYGLKGGGNQRDKNSGGARTYEAQLRLLGLLYKDKEGNLSLTQSGLAAVELEDLANTFIWQILKVQYPCQYSVGRNVNIDPSIKVRPFVLLLDLMQDPELNGLTDVDMEVPVVFGHNHATYDECKAKILLARKNGIASVLPDGEYLRTTKTIDTPYDMRLADIKDIANTFKNVLQGAGMIEERVVEEDKTRWFIGRNIIPVLNEVKQVPFVDFDKLEPLQAQLQYGLRKDSSKDTRRSLMPFKLPKLDTASGVIYERFLKDVELPATQRDITEFARKMTVELGISYDAVINALQPIINSSDTYVNNRLVELSKGGTTTAEAFEKNVTKIFEVDFGYESTWIGRKQRAGTGGYMDVFVVELGRNLCGIIDTKSMDVYDLPSQDVSKAKDNYVKHAYELYGSRNLELKFVAYISHLIGSGATTRAQDIYNDKHVPVTLISAYGLNDMRSDPALIGNASAVTNKLSSKPVNLIS
ncbi:hypothetical protein [Polynucleobacter sp. JS-JIR-5-A7]|uniref:hypothetical protein n=1 Tax=Polynucleobacter sp. JS-JIR-5-A7 TaxID=1758395 RepID=UPI001BFECB51|nr:hypothetical protein [Polynucleobacter sp. JS-JIR-5-A7]QWE06065.1 hypothetical protein AOC29_08060 [Polynucleobacter sp. JS-JIR-5-A7]